MALIDTAEMCGDGEAEIVAEAVEETPRRGVHREQGLPQNARAPASSPRERSLKRLNTASISISCTGAGATR
jgi:hypothetical protein